MKNEKGTGLVRLADVMPKRIKDLAKLRSPVQTRLIESSSDIALIQPEDIAYQHTFLCQT